MTRCVVIEWDNQQLRYLLGEANGDGLQTAVGKTFSWDEAEARGHVPVSLDAVAALLDGSPVVGQRGVIVARREHFERCRLVVPPVDDDQLPLLIKNHLAVESTFATDDLTYDYVELEGTSESPRMVLAIAMPETTLEEYRQLARRLKLKKPRLVLRTAGSAALLQRIRGDWNATSLIVAPLHEEVDLVVCERGKVCFGRTVFSTTNQQSSSYRKILTAEIARTLAVASEQLPKEVEVQQIVLFSPVPDERKREELEAEIDLPVVEVVPELPARNVELDNSEAVGEFAPLVGLLADEGAAKSHAIDLFRPPRRIRASRRRRPVVNIVAGLALLGLLIGYWAWSQVAQAEAEADQLAAELKELNSDVEQLADDGRTLEALNRWQENSIVWLDELRDISARFPPPGTAAVTSFTANPDRSGGAVIRISGKAVDPAIVTELDRTLSDEYRNVLSRNFREEAAAAEGAFAWRFESLIHAQSRSRKGYRQSLSLAEPGDNAEVAP